TMTNVTGDEYDDLAARVSALESQVRSLRARNADHRGEFAQVHEELSEMRDGLAAVRGELAEVRGERAEVREGLLEAREITRAHAAELEVQSLRLDRHYEFHLSHAAGLAALSETAREANDQVREILRRLDAALRLVRPQRVGEVLAAGDA